MNLLERVYLGGLRRSQQRMRANQKRLPNPVISVGNITVGGTGKTPTAIAVAEEAVRRGFAPVILTRGYRGSAKGPCFVGTGKALLLNVSEAGDEPVLMAGRLPGVPIVKSPDRYEGGMFALKHLADTVYAERDISPILFILDDGLQHIRLARDVDIVLIDGGNPFGNRRLLPVGPLREPLEALKRAHLLVITKQKSAPLVQELATFNPHAGLHQAFYRTDALIFADGTRKDTAALQNKRVYVFCGIANPQSFHATIASTGCIVNGNKKYRDHYSYGVRDLVNLNRIAERNGAELLVTTEKDLVKCSAYNGTVPLCALTVSFTFDAAFFDDLFARINRASQS
ncbi:MAG TPA: tetraacyldisaccharide 4'-kinase [Dissulfurispiraceae bacterium]|nr:tetraacyldisaccharide 4'-kinase [Dissulfurispiraceae bacterium]